MGRRPLLSYSVSLRPQIALLLLSLSAAAQNASVRGVITDQTSAVVPRAQVNISGPVSKSAVAAEDGSYQFSGLVPGTYEVRVSAPDLVLSKPVKISLKPGQQVLNLSMSVASVSQQITVSAASGSTITPEPSDNASAIVLSGADLDALADDPTDLAADLQALAGPSAGPNGGAIFIDGFSGGQLPSKDAIREIRINQNPFSPEYDKLGLGRIEIFTKPGSDKFRGSAFYNFADDRFNSRNPYAAVKAPFLLREYGGNLGGPVTSKSSFFVDVRRDATDNGSIINAVILDPAGAIRPFSDIYNAEQRSVRVSPRFDLQLSAKNTLTARYAYSNVEIPGAGTGSFNLASRGYIANTEAQTVQLAETAILSPEMIHEVRFQFFRSAAHDTPFTAGPAINVLGSFNGGGSTVGNSSDVAASYEFQDQLSYNRKRHSLRFGVRLRDLRDDTASRQNFNGTFTFGGASGVSSIEQYQAGRANQFSIVTGNPALSLSQFDAAVFVNDDWRVLPNVTLSLGLRYERQTNIHDIADFAPRIGVAWAPKSGLKGAKAKTVLRAGFGIFYDRFALANTLTAALYNGTRLRQIIVANPDFYPNIPAVDSFTSTPALTQKVAGDLRSPYILQSAVSVDRQLPGNTTMAVTWANSRGLHMLRSRVLPGPQYLMESSGVYNQNQLIVNVNSKLNAAVSLIGSYMLNYARSDTDGVGTFPARPDSFAGEYGPAATDIRNRVSFGGSLTTRWNIRLSPFLVAESGPPFDITVGRDLYGTTLFNARPGFADPSRPGAIQTPYGWLDPNPIPGERLVPRNYGRGPGSVLFNLRLAKTIGFGRRGEAKGDSPGNISGPPGANANRSNNPFGGGGISGLFGAPSTPRPYNLTISLAARNLLNHNNPGPIIGNLTSPLFGRANQAAGSREQGGGGFSEAANNRRFELQVRFTF